MNDSRRVINSLKQYRRNHYRSDQTELGVGIGDFAYNNPFAFLLGAALDRGVEWTRAWRIPRQLADRLGHLDPARIAAMPIDEVERHLRSLPVQYRHRFPRNAARSILSAAQLVSGRYFGDASQLWTGVSVKEAGRRLQEIFGIGPGITAMTLRILYDDFGLFRGQERDIDIKPDVHVKRVFRRTGLIDGDSEQAYVEAARQLNPLFPGELDWPAWEIGRRWCHAAQPECTSCPLGLDCPRHGI